MPFGGFAQPGRVAAQATGEFVRDMLGLLLQVGGPLLQHVGLAVRPGDVRAGADAPVRLGVFFTPSR